MTRPISTVRHPKQNNETLALDGFASIITVILAWKGLERDILSKLTTNRGLTFGRFRWLKVARHFHFSHSKHHEPQRVALAYTADSRWRNRAEFLQGRAAIEQFLTRKWHRELDYRWPLGPRPADHPSLSDFGF